MILLAVLILGQTLNGGSSNALTESVSRARAFWPIDGSRVEHLARDQQLSLSCPVSGDVSSVRWYHDGQLLDPAQYVGRRAATSPVSVRDGQLYFSGYRKRLKGTYYCVAHVAGIGSIRSADVKLDSSIKPRNDQLSADWRFVADPGQPLIVPCPIPSTATGSLLNMFRFTPDRLNSTGLVDNESNFVAAAPTQFSAAPYHPLLNGDLLITGSAVRSGRFTCATVNNFEPVENKVEQIGSVWVTVRPNRGKKPSSAPAVVYHSGMSAFSGSVLHGFSDGGKVEVTEGAGLVLSCVPERVASVRWTFQTKSSDSIIELNSGDNDVQLLANGIVLQISSTSQRWHGVFRCQVGSVQVRFSVSVKLRPRIGTPLSSSPSLLQADTRSVTLQCTAIEATSVKWYYNGESVDGRADMIKGLQKATGNNAVTVELRIENVRPGVYDGFFQCISLNDVGAAIEQLRLKWADSLMTTISAVALASSGRQTTSKLAAPGRLDLETISQLMRPKIDAFRFGVLLKWDFPTFEQPDAFKLIYQKWRNRTSADGGDNVIPEPGPADTIEKDQLTGSLRQFVFQPMDAGFNYRFAVIAFMLERDPIDGAWSQVVAFYDDNSPPVVLNDEDIQLVPVSAGSSSASSTFDGDGSPFDHLLKSSDDATKSPNGVAGGQLVSFATSVPIVSWMNNSRPTVLVRWELSDSIAASLERIVLEMAQAGLDQLEWKPVKTIKKRQLPERKQVRLQDLPNGARLKFRTVAFLKTGQQVASGESTVLVVDRPSNPLLPAVSPPSGQAAIVRVVARDTSIVVRWRYTPASFDEVVDEILLYYRTVRPNSDHPSNDLSNFEQVTLGGRDLASGQRERYLLRGLSPLTKYELYVVARNEGGFSEPSAFVNVTTQTPNLYYIQISDGLVSGSAEVRWNSAVGVVEKLSYYQIQYQLVDELETSTWTSVKEEIYPPMTSYSVNDLKPGSKYHFRLIIVSDDSGLEFGDYETFRLAPAGDQRPTTGLGEGDPSFKPVIESYETFSNAVVLRWRYTGGKVDSFTVLFRESSEENVRTVSEVYNRSAPLPPAVGDRLSQFEVRSLAAGITYEFMVVAYTSNDGHTQSHFSEPLLVKTGGAVLPESPSDTTTLSGQSSNGIMISDTDSSNRMLFIVVGSCFGTAVIVVIVLVALCWYKQRHRKQPRRGPMLGNGNGIGTFGGTSDCPVSDTYYFEPSKHLSSQYQMGTNMTSATNRSTSAFCLAQLNNGHVLANGQAQQPLLFNGGPTPTPLVAESSLTQTAGTGSKQSTYKNGSLPPPYSSSMLDQARQIANLGDGASERDSYNNHLQPAVNPYVRSNVTTPIDPALIYGSERMPQMVSELDDSQSPRFGTFRPPRPTSRTSSLQRRHPPGPGATSTLLHERTRERERDLDAMSATGATANYIQSTSPRLVRPVAGYPAPVSVGAGNYMSPIPTATAAGNSFVSPGTMPMSVPVQTINEKGEPVLAYLVTSLPHPADQNAFVRGFHPSQPQPMAIDVDSSYPGVNLMPNMGLPASHVGAAGYNPNVAHPRMGYFSPGLAYARSTGLPYGNQLSQSEHMALDRSDRSSDTNLDQSGASSNRPSSSLQRRRRRKQHHGHHQQPASASVSTTTTTTTTTAATATSESGKVDESNSAESPLPSNAFPSFVAGPASNHWSSVPSQRAELYAVPEASQSSLLADQDVDNDQNDLSDGNVSDRADRLGDAGASSPLLADGRAGSNHLEHHYEDGDECEQISRQIHS